MANKSEQIWQFLSQGGRMDIISGSEIDEIYTGDDIDQDKLAQVAAKDYHELHLRGHRLRHEELSYTRLGMITHALTV